MHELPAILLFGMLLPGMIVSFDLLLMTFVSELRGIKGFLIPLGLCFAGQSAISSFASGAFLKHGVLRWGGTR